MKSFIINFKTVRTEYLNVEKIIEAETLEDAQKQAKKLLTKDIKEDINNTNNKTNIEVTNISYENELVNIEEDPYVITKYCDNFDRPDRFFEFSIARNKRGGNVLYHVKKVNDALYCIRTVIDHNWGFGTNTCTRIYEVLDELNIKYKRNECSISLDADNANKLLLHCKLCAEHSQYSIDCSWECNWS